MFDLVSRKMTKKFQLHAELLETIQSLILKDIYGSALVYPINFWSEEESKQSKVILFTKYGYITVCEDENKNLVLSEGIAKIIEKKLNIYDKIDGVKLLLRFNNGQTFELDSIKDSNNEDLYSHYVDAIKNIFQHLHN